MLIPNTKPCPLNCRARAWLKVCVEPSETAIGHRPARVIVSDGVTLNAAAENTISWPGYLIGRIVVSRASMAGAAVNSPRARHVVEARQLVVGLERRRRNQLPRRDAERIGSERHVRDVQKPSLLDVVGLVPQDALEDLDCPRRALPVPVDAVALDGEKA